MDQIEFLNLFISHLRVCIAHAMAMSQQTQTGAPEIMEAACDEVAAIFTRIKGNRPGSALMTHGDNILLLEGVHHRCLEILGEVTQ